MKNEKTKDVDPKKLSEEGFAYLSNNNFSEAKIIFEKLISYFPKNIQLLNILGFIYLQLDSYGQALKVYDESFLLNEKQPETLFNRAIVKSKLKKYEDALSDYDKLLEEEPNNLNIYVNKSSVYEDMNDYVQALFFINYAISKEPKNSKFIANRGNIYNETEKFDLAMKDYLLAIQLDPKNAELYSSLGTILTKLGNYTAAIEAYNQAILLDKQMFKAHNNLSILLLARKEFKLGWKEYEYRWKFTEKPSLVKKIPEYSDLKGIDNLLIWGEQGIGDQIIYSSWLNDIPENLKVTLAIDSRLNSIFKRSFPKINVINFSNIQDKHSYTGQIALASMGRFLRGSLNSFKNQPIAFLKPDKNQAEKYRNTLFKKNKLICGISWKSSNKKTGKNKSLTLNDLLEVLKIENISFVDLQYGNNESEKSSFEEKHSISLNSIKNLDKFNDLNGLLSLIEACDFVVTSSNITAHLAGSIGKKTFLMAPYSVGQLWYWHGDKQSIWYPSITIFRQSRLGYWKDVVNNIKKEIRLNFL